MVGKKMGRNPRILQEGSVRIYGKWWSRFSGIDFDYYGFSDPVWILETNMKIYIQFVRSSFLAVSLLFLPICVTASEAPDSKKAESLSSGRLSDTLVIVEKIVGIDEQGNLHTLYNEEDGRVYRLDNIDQVVLDMNARGIKSKGTFRSLQVVLGKIVYLMGVNDNPQPVLRVATEIPERLPLAVDNLRITKDQIIAIYTTNCENAPI
ncbi:MAG: hypothetical protein KZQ95_22065 [Candidatus Thiodiazotropha sp. (ex Epidulcina cf. delphinae)]|nr:hypothetical protein [Candidatus Thiodiazotropha sp. (ex Epidulcina cf. delphinae)]